MRTAGAAVLQLWDRGCGLAAPQRALLLADHGARVFGLPPVEADAPLGRHHAVLLRLRSTAFGADVEATASCPACGEVVEFELDADELAAVTGAGEVVAVEHDGYRVTWRSPSAADLAEVASRDDAEGELLRRCVHVAQHPDGTPVAGDALPPAVRAAVSVAMAAADPLAEILVELTCPACGTAFRGDVDVAAFVWAEVEARARRVLLDVDVLARAYGWTEADVLELSEPRRLAYLRIVDEARR